MDEVMTIPMTVTEDSENLPMTLDMQMVVGGGMSNAVKTALLNCFAHVAWADEHGQTYYDALYNALNVIITAVTVTPSTLSLNTIGATSQLVATTTPVGGSVTWLSSDPSVATVSASGLVTIVGYGSATITATSGGVSGTCSVTVTQATLVSISANYTQGGIVYDTDSLDSLKSDLVVTATWSDSTTTTVPSSDYTLSGTLTAGTSNITVSYGEETTTFNVTVTHKESKSDMDGWTDGVKYTDLTIIQNEYIDNTDGSFDPYNGWNRTGYVPINGASLLALPAMSGTGGPTRYNAFYTENHAFISAFNILHGAPSAVAVPSNAYYFVLSESANMLNEIITSGVKPIE